MSPETLSFVVPPLSAKTRLDRWLAAQEGLRAEGRSRSQIAGWIEAGLVRVNGKAGKPGLALAGGERVEVEPPPPREIRAAPEALEIEVVYEDADIAVVVKPAGMVTHPAPGSPSGTLVNALLHRLRDLSGVGGALRPGIVHRLDKETSGLLVVAKNDFAHRGLSAALKAREVRRTYLGLVHGRMSRESGTVDAPIGRHRTERKRMSVRAPVSRSAVTHWRRLRQWPEVALLEIRLETGRTHQIRVHLAAEGHPVVADAVYGRKKPSAALAKALGRRHFLHAARLELAHPRTGEPMRFEAPLPAELEAALATLKGESK